MLPGNDTQNKDSISFCDVMRRQPHLFLLLSWDCVRKPWRLSQLGLIAASPVGWWSRTVSSCTWVNWGCELGLLYLGWAQLLGMLALAKRKRWSSLGPDGTRARELSQLEGPTQRQRCNLQCQRGQPCHGSWESAHWGWCPCQRLGREETSYNLQGRDKGKDAARCWIPAQWAMMVLGNAPDPAVDWNTKQEIEAAGWCLAHQTPRLQRQDEFQTPHGVNPCPGWFLWAWPMLCL